MTSEINNAKFSSEIPIIFPLAKATNDCVMVAATQGTYNAHKKTGKSGGIHRGRTTEALAQTKI